MKGIKLHVFSPDLICGLDDGYYMVDFITQSNEGNNEAHVLQFSVPESIEDTYSWERLMIHYGIDKGLIGRPCYLVRNKNEMKCFQLIQRTVDTVAIHKL